MLKEDKFKQGNYMFKQLGKAFQLTTKTGSEKLPKEMKYFMRDLGFQKTNAKTYIFVGEGDPELILLKAGFSPWTRPEYNYYCPNCHYTVSSNRWIDNKLLCTECWEKLLPERKRVNSNRSNKNTL